jgi:hypothetical protein
LIPPSQCLSCHFLLFLLSKCHWHLLLDKLVPFYSLLCRFQVDQDLEKIKWRYLKKLV